MSEENVTTYRIVEGDPLSATVICRVDGVAGASRLEHRRSGPTSTMTCDAEQFVVTSTLDAFEDDVRVHARTFTHRFPRDGA